MFVPSVFVTVCHMPAWVSLQVQAYKLAIEQHRNFELRVPANVTVPANFPSSAEALLHSSSGSVGQPGSMDGMFAMPAGGQGTSAQQGPMHGVRGWGNGNAANGSGTPQPADSSKQQWGEGSGNLAAVVAATAAAAERSHPPPSEFQARRRSIGGMRYIRFQFRSVSSVGSHMAPAVSVPPALVSVDRTNYYWGTVDIPASSVHGEHLNDLGGYTFGVMQANGVSMFACSAGCLLGRRLVGADRDDVGAAALSVGMIVLFR